MLVGRFHSHAPDMDTSSSPCFQSQRTAHKLFLFCFLFRKSSLIWHSVKFPWGPGPALAHMLAPVTCSSFRCFHLCARPGFKHRKTIIAKLLLRPEALRWISFRVPYSVASSDTGKRLARWNVYRVYRRLR